MIALLN